MREGTKCEKRKNLLIAAGIVCILVIGTVAAYFTSTDEASNVFTVGKVDITLTEPNWDSEEEAGKHAGVVPNQVLLKDPTITNVSEHNDAYVFLRVTVPKRSVKTADLTTGQVSSSAVSQDLFQMNSTANLNSNWKGVNTGGNRHSYNDTWVDSIIDDSDPDNTVYILSWVEDKSIDKPKCKVLKPGESTTAFSSVTFANIIEGQGLDGTDLNLRVEAFAIQTENIGGTGTNAKTTVDAVWKILKKQIDTNGLNNGNALTETESAPAEEENAESGN